MKQGHDHVELILDRSGSMAQIKTDMEGALKTFLDDQRNVDGRTMTVGLTVFDDQIEPQFEARDINEVTDIEINPRNMTALLDAVGSSIVRLGERLAKLDESERPEHVFVAIITDGLENASREWTNEKVKDLIETQTNQWNWHFTFMGAEGADAFEQAGAIGIANGQTTTYSNDRDGTVAVAAAYSANVTNTRNTGQVEDMPDNVGN